MVLWLVALGGGVKGRCESLDFPMKRADVCLLWRLVALWRGLAFWGWVLWGVPALVLACVLACWLACLFP